MSFDVYGKVALVTGANRGIGAQIVGSLIKHGARKVYAGVRSPEKASALVEAHGANVVPVVIDLVNPATITAAAAIASDVEVVVNNAGVLQTAAPLDGSAIDTLQTQMDVNVYGLIRMAQSFAPVLKANGGGAFVQLNSVASIKSFAAFATYSASKAAAYSITAALHDVLAPEGIAVLSVHPGPIASDMAKQAGLLEIAEPASVVAEGIVAALKAGDFHLFPDSMAQQVYGAYMGFAKNVVEADIMAES